MRRILKPNPSLSPRPARPRPKPIRRDSTSPSQRRAKPHSTTRPASEVPDPRQRAPSAPWPRCCRSAGPRSWIPMACSCGWASHLPPPTGSAALRLDTPPVAPALHHSPTYLLCRCCSHLTSIHSALSAFSAFSQLCRQRQWHAYTHPARLALCMQQTSPAAARARARARMNMHTCQHPRRPELQE